MPRRNNKMDFQLKAELLGDVIYITALERLQQIFCRPSGNSRRHPMTSCRRDLLIIGRARVFNCRVFCGKAAGCRPLSLEWSASERRHGDQLYPGLNNGRYANEHRDLQRHRGAWPDTARRQRSFTGENTCVCRHTDVEVEQVARISTPHPANRERAADFKMEVIEESTDGGV